MSRISSSGRRSAPEGQRSRHSLKRLPAVEAIFQPVRPLTPFEETVERLGSAIRIGLLSPAASCPPSAAAAANYTPRVLLVFLIVAIWWQVSAKHRETGPVRTLEEDEVTRD